LALNSVVILSQEEPVRLWVSGAMMLMATSAIAQAQDKRFDEDRVLRQAMNNFAHENIECAAFYTVFTACLINDKAHDNRELIGKYQNSYSAAMQMGALASERANLKKETVQVRLEMSVQSQMSLIENNCGNASLILNKYALQCKRLMEAPQERMEQLTGAAIRAEAK
jgi:hypothetical protein